MSLTLRSGEWEAELRPQVGGCVASLTRGGIEVLRTMPAGSTDPLEAACFPLVPYCNRIHDGRFAWREREVRLPANFPPEPHSLHGLGWQQPWTVTREAGFKCALTHSHDGSGGWPWPYDAELRMRLGAQGCAITLDVTNRADEPMPCGLGLHPYLRRRPDTRVGFAARAILEADEGLIPTGTTSSAGDWADGQLLPARTIDHCFVGWIGSAAVRDDLGTVTLAARGAPCLHLYAPADGSALCLEPVGHPPNALNSAPEAMIALPPGGTASLTLWIGASL